MVQKQIRENIFNIELFGLSEKCKNQENVKLAEDIHWIKRPALNKEFEQGSVYHNILKTDFNIVFN